MSLHRRDHTHHVSEHSKTVVSAQTGANRPSANTIHTTLRGPMHDAQAVCVLQSGNDLVEEPSGVFLAESASVDYQIEKVSSCSELQHEVELVGVLEHVKHAELTRDGGESGGGRVDMAGAWGTVVCRRWFESGATVRGRPVLDLDSQCSGGRPQACG